MRVPVAVMRLENCYTPFTFTLPYRRLAVGFTATGNESVPKIITNDRKNIFYTYNQHFGNYFKPQQFPSAV